MQEPEPRDADRLAEQFADIDADGIVREERAASRKIAGIEAGRRKGGIAGAAIAGAMLTLHEIYEGPPPDDVVVVSESPDDPTDIDADGIDVTVGDVNVWAPPPGPPSDER